jgi:imidazolonepropionase-like amidohydrolase
MDREKGLPPHLSLDELSTVADGPVEARRAVRLNLRYDVDFIKTNITISEHVRRYSGYCAPEMTKETMAAMFEEAHWHGRKVTAHGHGGPGVTWAIEAGIDGIEHGMFLDERQLEMMAERGVAFCPTLTVMGHMREDMAAGVLSGIPYFEPWREKAVGRAWDTVNKAHKIGVLIISGTDSSWPGCRHGENAYDLEMLVEAGLSPMEAIVAATGASAKGIGFPDVGTVKPGKYADLVFVDGDPLKDIKILQDLKRIPVVIKGGEIVVKRG